MADNPLTLRLLSPEEVILEEQVASVRIPGQDGLFGVLRRHAAMVALTDSGVLKARKAGGEVLEYLVHDGFAEVRDDVVTVLTRAAEKPGEIDLERARQAARRAREGLRGQRSDYDYARATAALRRAMKREQLAQRG